MMKVVLSIVLAIVLCCGLVGCNDEKIEQADRFELVHEEGSMNVVVDKETGVMYLFLRAGYAGGVTVMVDADGNPLIYEESENE